MATDPLGVIVLSSDLGELERRYAMLCAFGFEVTEFLDPDDVIEHFSELRRDEADYALLVTDIQVGRQRAFRVADIFCEMTGNAPVIFIYDGPQNFQSVIPAAQLAFLASPFTEQMLRQTIHKLLPAHALSGRPRALIVHHDQKRIAHWSALLRAHGVDTEEMGATEASVTDHDRRRPFDLLVIDSGIHRQLGNTSSFRAVHEDTAIVVAHDAVDLDIQLRSAAGRRMIVMPSEVPDDVFIDAVSSLIPLVNPQPGSDLMEQLRQTVEAERR